MNQDEAWLANVTREQARSEIARHHCDWHTFIAEVGDKPGYTGAEVLSWLGY